MGTDRRFGPSWVKPVVSSLVVVAVGAGAAGVALDAHAVAAGVEVSWTDEPGSVGVAWSAMTAGAAAVYAGIGAVLAAKRPGNVLGWLLLAFGFGLNVGLAADRYAGYGGMWVLPRAQLVSFLAGWMWLPASFVGLVLVPLLFPTGRPLTPRWRWVGWFGGAAVVTAVATWMWIDLRHTDLAVARDWEALEGLLVFRIGELTWPVLLLTAVAAWVSVAFRFARSSGEERQQLTLFVSAVALTVAYVVAANFVPADPTLQWVEVTVGAVVMPSIAVAIAVAVLRYRLYDIDRIVSRTVSYGLLTAVLVGVYAVGVLGLGGIVRSTTGGGGGDLVVAASTLAVAALFGPARRRIQASVDRRFNRASYDAQQTVEVFAQRLRDEIDVEVLTDDLARVAATSLRPTYSSVWLTSNVEAGVGP